MPAAATAWTSNPEVTDGTTATTVPILTGDERMPLTNGALYDVQVRACNGATDLSDCGEWTQQSATPEAPRPQNLNLTPLGNRRARLSWTWPNPGAAPQYYEVDARVFRPDPNNESWHEINWAKGGGADTFREFRLNEFGPSHRGLAQHSAYELRVRGRFETEDEMNPTISYSEYSNSIVIIDTPITRVTAADALSTRNVILEYETVQIALDDSSYPSGDYEFRYRKISHDQYPHTALLWKPNVHTPIVGGKLEENKVYGVQLVFTPATSSGYPVFAARDAYVWPSDHGPGRRDRVASFPVGGTKLNSRSNPNRLTYTYRICDYTLPTDTVQGWKDFINNAFLRWQSATSNHIVIEYESGDCADYTLFINEAADIAFDSVTIGDILTPEEMAEIRSEIQAEIESMFQSLADMGLEPQYDQILLHDARTSEVRLTNGPNVWFLTTVGAFPELSTSFGLDSCGFTENGCAITTGIDYPRRGPVTDILINYARYAAAEPKQPARVQYDLCVDESGSPMNGSVDQRLYRTLVHEVGHALGIRFPESQGIPTLSHPNSRLNDSVMSYESTAYNLCSPTQLDRLAVHAIYQSEY